MKYCSQCYWFKNNKCSNYAIKFDHFDTWLQEYDYREKNKDNQCIDFYFKDAPVLNVSIVNKKRNFIFCKLCLFCDIEKTHIFVFEKNNIDYDKIERYTCSTGPCGHLHYIQIHNCTHPKNLYRKNTPLKPKIMFKACRDINRNNNCENFIFNSIFLKQLKHKIKPTEKENNYGQNSDKNVIILGIILFIILSIVIFFIGN